MGPVALDSFVAPAWRAALATGNESLISLCIYLPLIHFPY